MRPTAPALSRSAALLLAALLVAALAAPPAVRAQDEVGLFFDTVDVNIVNLEVVVTDRDGNPVTGLTREDFEVYEDGERIELTNFFAVENRATVPLGGLPGEPGEPGEAAPGEVLPTPETQRLHLVVFIDDLNITPQSRNLIFDNLKTYLAESLDPRDRVMLVTLDGAQVEIAQPFTSDPEVLLSTLAGLEKAAGRGAHFQTELNMFMNELQDAPLAPPSQGRIDSPANFDSSVLIAERLAQTTRFLAEQRFQRIKGTVTAMERFCDSLAGMAGRKAILYVSDGLPVRTSDSLVDAWTGKYEDWILQNDLQRLTRELTSLTAMDFDASKDLERLVARASANRVAFYPISIGMTQSRSSISAEFRGSGSLSGRGPHSLDNVNLERTNLEGSLLQLAEGTGGLAFTRSANVGELIERMTRDFETFYSLGYNSPAGDGEFHEVEVKVKEREGLKVRHLKGYRDKEPMEHLQDLTLSALHYGIQDNPLEVRLDPGEEKPAEGKRVLVPVMVMIPFQKLLLLPEATSHKGQVSVFVVARDEKGGLSPFQRIDLPIEIPNDRMVEALSGAAAYPMQLEMRPGKHTIAVGVRDHLARVDATLHLELMVGAREGG